MPPNSANNTPQGPQNGNPGVYNPGNSPFSGGTGGRKKLPLIIIGSVAVVFILLIIGAVLLSNRQNPTEEPEAEDISTVEPEGPQPATSLDVENTDNSITQDISSLNDDEDFPPEQLSDDSLEL